MKTTLIEVFQQRPLKQVRLNYKLALNILYMHMKHIWDQFENNIINKKTVNKYNYLTFTVIL